MSRQLEGNWSIESVEINLTSAVNVDGFDQLQIDREGIEILPKRIRFEIIEKELGGYQLQAGSSKYSAEVVSNQSHLRICFRRPDLSDQIIFNAIR